MTKFYKDKQQIINWLNKYKVENYTLIPDEQYGFIVNVNGDVDLSDKKLLNIPVKFSKVSGNFYCGYNKLTSLEFSPQTVGGNFSCNYNPKLKEIQEINDFNLIFLEHKKTLITKFSDKLEHELINDNSKKNAKIKI